MSIVGHCCLMETCLSRGEEAKTSIQARNTMSQAGRGLPPAFLVLPNAMFTRQHCCRAARFWSPAASLLIPATVLLSTALTSMIRQTELGRRPATLALHVLLIRRLYC